MLLYNVIIMLHLFINCLHNNIQQILNMRRPYYQAPRPSVGGRIQSPLFATSHKRTNHKGSKSVEECPSGAAAAQQRRHQQKMADRECSGFEPQNYLRDRCKKCFRLREKHDGLTANFVRATADQRKETESVVLRSQLRSPIVTVRRAQSNPAKMLTTSTPTTTTTSSSSTTATRKTLLHQHQQQQHDNKNEPADKNNVGQKKSSDKKKATADEEREGQGQATPLNAVSRKSQEMPTVLRTIAIETDEREVMGQNANREENKMPNDDKFKEQKEDQKGTAAAECARPTETRRRMWKLSSVQQQQDAANKERNLENDNEYQRNLQQNGHSPVKQQQQADKAQPKLPSATTTVLLSKQRQISLGHSNSLREQRKNSKNLTTTSCPISTDNEVQQNERNGTEEKKGEGTTRKASSTRRTTAKEEQQQQQEQRNGRRKLSERNGSWQFMGDKFRAATAADVQQQQQQNDDAADEDELLSLSSYKSANSLLDRSANTNGTRSAVDEQQLFSAHSVDSLNSLSCAESFKTGKSPPFDDPMEDPFMTPKSTTEAQHFFGSDDDDFERAMTPTAMEFNQQEFCHLRVENRRLQDQCRRYRHERKRWTEWLRKKYGNWKERDNSERREQQTTTATIASMPIDGKRLMEEALNEMETLLNEYREENSALKGRMMGQARLHDCDTMSASVSTVISNGTGSAPGAAADVQLEERLQMSESMCEQLRRERKELEREIEEMQDQYRVEEIEEFRELQRELEQSAKNGRILQFKLRKVERQREQLQTEKNLLARKVQEVQRGIRGGEMEEMMGECEDIEEQMGSGRRVAELEQELRVAKEVSLKLQNELEVAEEKRYKLEDELFYQREKVRELLAQNRWREARQAKGRSVEEALLEASRSADNLPKEVRDTLEREADLREQLRFTEADLQRTRQRLHELERENDELLQRYSNLVQRHSEAQSKTANILLMVPQQQRQKAILRSISEGADESAAVAPQKHRSEERKSGQQMNGRSASAAETNRITMSNEQTILTEQSEENRQQLSKMAQEADELRRKCANCEREVGEMRKSADAYKRMNEALKEQVGKWEENERRKETKSMEQVQKAEKERKNLRKQLAEECQKRESAEQSLAENRAVLEKLNTTIIETNAELNRARQKMGDLEQEQDKQKKWETKCREMKQERMRIQANAMELKKRTDEAVQELGRMSKTHQQKELTWMREKRQLEEQLRQHQQQMNHNNKAEQKKKNVSELGSQSSSTTSESQKQRGTTAERVEELEQEKKCLETKMDELRKIREQTEKQHWQREREQMAGKMHHMNDVDSHTNSSSSSSVDYKKIADNALRAAEALQKQYREYQKHYTAEVHRLNSKLVKLEQELAARQHLQQQIVIMGTDDGQQKQRKKDENNNNNSLNNESNNNGVNVSAVIKMPVQYPAQQQQHVVTSRSYRGYESPSLSSLTENNFTDNTTWDSRLLDCGSMMTRSISPLKGQCLFKGAPTVPTLQCRTVDIPPSALLAELAQRGGAIMDDGDFGSVEDVQQKYRRTGSAGTNILYRIRRDELAQGKHPTVRQMARAFESFEKLQQKGNSSEEPRRKRIKPAKGGLFGLLGKSSSMEVSSMTEKQLKTPKALRKGDYVPNENVPFSAERIGPHGSPSPLPSTTLPRGGRNPFKGFSSRIVERVRRSLSRSKKNLSRDGGQSREGTPSQKTTITSSRTAAAEDLKWN